MTRPTSTERVQARQLGDQHLGQWVHLDATGSGWLFAITDLGHALELVLDPGTPDAAPLVLTLDHDAPGPGDWGAPSARFVSVHPYACPGCGWPVTFGAMKPRHTTDGRLVYSEGWFHLAGPDAVTVGGIQTRPACANPMQVSA